MLMAKRLKIDGGSFSGFMCVLLFLAHVYTFAAAMLSFACVSLERCSNETNDINASKGRTYAVAICHIFPSVCNMH